MQNIANQVDLIEKSRIFDSDFYKSHDPSLAVIIDPIRHYVEYGSSMGYSPSPYFDENWYLSCNEDVKINGINPLIHYIIFGDREGRPPSVLFNAKWYRSKYNIDKDTNCLSHYNSVKLTLNFNPNPYFDSYYYVNNNRDINRKILDAFLDFYYFGYFENRKPFPNIDLDDYQQYLKSISDVDCHPFKYYIKNITAYSNNTKEQLVQSDRMIPDSPSSERAAPEEHSNSPILERRIAKSLVDPSFYRAFYPDVAASGGDPVEHFLQTGLREGRRPNLYVDGAWYRQTYLADQSEEMDPLIHYITIGEAAGNKPSEFFDPLWYRKQYGIDDQSICLVHYLEHRNIYQFSPLPDFDIIYYIENNRDVQSAQVDAFEHFLFTGYKEGRNPSSDFQIKYYSNKFLGGDLSSNPFLHYLRHKGDGIHHGIPPKDEATLPRELKRFTQRSIYFEEVSPIAKGKQQQAMVLAYYLPQFHAFPENDAWWGAGFTEWTNIPRGIPRFQNHYQPRIPRDLGYYSLENTDVVRRQIEMALNAGISGFVYYYYWFNGKRLMEGPMESLLTDHTLEMPFALMWANENWTRRWDGAESEVLISQDYNPEDDQKLISDLARHFRDSRYIRIEGRPLLMVYRPGIIPDAKIAIARWRDLFLQEHGENPIIIMAQAFNDNDPRAFDLDGAIEFPPHKLTATLPSIHQELDYLDDEFSGRVYRYESLVEQSLSDIDNDFPLIKTVVPSWDNDARRQGTGLIVTGSTPAKYQHWLSEIIDHAKRHPFFEKPLVCVNAWNEWCEAAYLEPDLHFGGAYLNATARAIIGLPEKSSPHSILLVGHDAFPSGAQHLLLHIGQKLQSRFGFNIEFLLLGDGAMISQYQAIAKTHVCNNEQDIVRVVGSLKERGYTGAIINSLAAAGVTGLISDNGFLCVNLIHELPQIIASMNLNGNAAQALKYSDAMIFASAYVRDAYFGYLDTEPSPKADILPQGCYKSVQRDQRAGKEIRRQLGIGKADRVIIGVGYADLRKGFDLFLQAWRNLSHNSQEAVHAIWLGDIDQGLANWLATEIRLATESGRFHMMGFQKDIGAYLNAADMFVLASREDPFPTVVHEALSVGLPVVAFSDAGGMSDYLAEHDLGTVVAHGDVMAMADAIRAEFDAPTSTFEQERRIKFVADNLNFDRYVEKLSNIAVPTLPRVSVVVPNYNYAHYMEQRLGSIFRQTLPVCEIVVLDDCSSDDSLTVIPEVAQKWNREINLLPNKKNSGSVFAQWRKAAEEAKGEFIWIAEADDDSAPAFLERLTWMMSQDDNIALGFTDSRTIDMDGAPLDDSYQGYYATVEPDALTTDTVMLGTEFVERFLSVKNLILNVSGVLWRRTVLLEALEACEAELKQYKMAGDWHLYLCALAKADRKIAYIAESLNVHRRHSSSVTHALDVERHIDEISRCHWFAKSLISNNLSYVIERQKGYIIELHSSLNK